ncbi:uncharacterized protein FIBRA_02501 [Fibroporia radiculosa]|uniref:Probable methionine--tRNA ligase, mitochondrial n=1 Tax=Fibroporia radiculosa TaxID=599839 RepID=J4G1Q7_9APHY|nr:uncharacterized protein FIBRA_02501 [Fibroporia radiculosa]CCM00468.1 predicted protein [Fibroporia radiculosa]
MAAAFIDIPHIGHLHSLVTADIFARYARLENPHRPVYFMTGTDEHGMKIQKAAQARDMDPLSFCDELSEHFRALVKKANISSTRFSRTSEPQHREAVQHLWRKLDARGLLYKGRHSGWYSVSDECFYPDLQVKRVSTPGGEDYHVSTETGSRVEWMEEENYMFRQSVFQDVLRSHYESVNPRAIYPPQHHADILQTLSGPVPLEDLSVSRPRSRLSWGVPVPDDPEHTIYVWIDALTVYLSSSGYPWTKEGDLGVSRGWPPNVQVIGKDILRFHAIYLPMMLLALDLPLSQRLLSHSHWTVNRHKMSKSVGNVADPIEAIDEFSIDVVRWYLARVGGHFRDDVDWSHEQLQKHAREITSLLGNLFSRITSAKIRACVKGHDRVDSQFVPEAASLIASTSLAVPLYCENMRAMRVADALDGIVAVLQEANLLMTQTKPWAPNTSLQTVVDVYAAVLECLRVCGILLQPFIPSKAALLLDSLGVPVDERSLQFAQAEVRSPAAVRPGVILFEKPSKAVS